MRLWRRRCTVPIYDTACAWALAGDLDRAWVRLQDALAAGYDNAALIRSDSDIESLKNADPARLERLLGGVLPKTRPR